MNKEILTVVDVVSNEKGVSKEIIFEALEAALASATKRPYREDIDVRVAIDPMTGEYKAFRRWEVVEEVDLSEAEDSQEGLDNEESKVAVNGVEFPDRQLLLPEARERQADIALGEYIEEPMEPAEFGRIAAQTAKQVIVQKVREAERAVVFEDYKGREGELVSGVVKRADRGHVTLDLGGKAEAIIPREEMIPREAVRAGDRLRGYLKRVEADARGPQLFVSRIENDLLVELFKIEVPEISEGIVEILGAARDPGLRAKIAVRSNEARLDPVGACVGMRGSRVQAVSNELAGERVDIILWDENPAQFVINAMSPAEVVSITVDEDSRCMDIAVVEGQLSQAIGRNGQNVRLASELTEWRLNVMSESDAQEKSDIETQKLQEMFMSHLDVDEEVASILVQEGFSSLEEVAYVPEKEMTEIEEFDQDLVAELRQRSKDLLVTREIIREEKLGDLKPAADLLAMDGMEEALAYQLVGLGIVTMEDLAEQAIDDLMVIDDMDEERAGSLIMTARAPWFEDQDETPGED